MNRYVVAVRREMRSPDTNVEIALSIPGVDVVNVSPRGRMIIEADNETIRKMRMRFGDQLIIEPEAFYTTLPSTAD